MKLSRGGADNRQFISNELPLRIAKTNIAVSHSARVSDVWKNALDIVPMRRGASEKIT